MPLPNLDLLRAGLNSPGVTGGWSLALSCGFASTQDSM